jgi:intein/homing endonuclease
MLAWEPLKKKNKKPLVAIVCPHTGSASWEFIEKSWVPLRSAVPPEFDLRWLMSRTPSISVARNSLVHDGLAGGIDYFMWLDSDIIVENMGIVDAVRMMFTYNVPIISGLYRAKQTQGFNYAAWIKAQNLGKGFGYVPIAGWTPGANYIDVDVVGMGFCVHPNTLIETRQGWARADEITVGDMVKTHLGTYDRVSAISKRAVNEKLLQITPYKMALPVQLTVDHKVLAFKRTHGMKWKKPKWYKACELTIGDFVCYPRKTTREHRDRWDNLDLRDHIPSDMEPITKHNKITLPTSWSPVIREHIWICRKIPLSHEFMEFLGLYTAEGSSSGGTVEFDFNIKETHLADKIVNFCNLVLGLRANVTTNGNTLRVRISNMILTTVLTKLCGKGARNKQIPFIVKTTTMEMKKSYLHGLFEGDGSIVETSNSNRYSTLASVSIKLIHDVKEMLIHDFNIVPSIQYRREIVQLADGTTEFYNDAYILSIFNDHSFLDNTLDYTKYRILDKYIALPIREIREIYYDGPVYDFQVGKTHTYCTSSFIVHNCMIKREVFEKVEAPWFVWNDIGENSEDFYFFEKARQAGYGTKVMTEIKLSHIGDLVVTFDGKFRTTMV